MPLDHRAARICLVFCTNSSLHFDDAQILRILSYRLQVRWCCRLVVLVAFFRQTDSVKTLIRVWAFFAEHVQSLPPTQASAPSAVMPQPWP